ncbi:MAG: hypothetical protein J6T40_08375 [Clostridiales bacterium]|nr:hypothetical protein [Clostridiales bacterium]
MSKVAPGRMELVGVLVSDPQVPDSDYDGVNDAEDARPTVVNPDLIYILASPHFVNQGKALARVYRSAGLEHLLLNFDGAESFRLNWNSIGLYGGSTLEYGDKYYYNVRNVVISSHGSSECLVLENKKQPQHLWRGGTYQDGSLTVSQLKNKKIHSLNLYACSCGEFRADLSENIAEVFLREKSGIEQVVAFDTTLVGTATRGGKAFSYWGWTYSQAIPLSDSDYDYFISMYGHEGAFYNDSDKFVHDNSDVLGFRCFRRDGSGGYTTINIFNDDIRIGKLYYNTAPDATGNLVTRYFLHEDDLEYDYNQIHDPVLVGY